MVSVVYVKMFPGRYKVKGGGGVNDRQQRTLEKQKQKKLQLTSFQIDGSNRPKNMLNCRLPATYRSSATYSGTAGARQLGETYAEQFQWI